MIVPRSNYLHPQTITHHTMTRKISAEDTAEYDFLGHIYDAVMAPQGFQLFAEKLVEVFNLKAVLMAIRHNETLDMKYLWMGGGIVPHWTENYALDYASDDILAQHLVAAPIANFYASNLDIAFPPNFPDTRFYKEWLAPQGVAFAAAAVVLQEGPWETQLYLQRSPEQPPFTPDEIAQFNTFLPHLQRAIQMRQRLSGLQLGQDILASSLNMLAMPTFLFDEYATVAHYNRSAETLLGSGYLRLENGHLQTPDDKLTRKLNLELSKSIVASRSKDEDFNHVILLPRSGKLPLMLMITPLQLQDSPRIHGAALMFAFDPEAIPAATSELIKKLFRLTNAEAELSIALCSGKTLDEFASERDRSIHTVKTQLKNIYLKTGTNRQAQLVSMLLASPAFFVASKEQDQLSPPSP